MNLYLLWLKRRALVRMIIPTAIIVIAGMVCFCILVVKADDERLAEYRQGWNYAGAMESLKASPNEPAAHNAMANVWMKQKQYDKAVAEYSQVIKLEPKNPYNHLGLGNALNCFGQTARARKEWAIAAKLDVAGGDAATEATHHLTPSK